MSPRVVDRQKRREEIIATSLDLFVRKGFRGTSIRDLAANAGVSMGTLYHYFESKEELFNLTVRHFFSADRMILSRKLGDISDAFDRLEKLAELMSANLSEYQKVLLSFMDFVVSTEDTQEVRRVCTEILSEYAELVSQIFRDGIAQGQMRDVPPEDTSNMVMAFFDGVVLHSHTREDFDFEKVARAFLDILRYGVMKLPERTLH